MAEDPNNKTQKEYTLEKLVKNLEYLVRVIASIIMILWMIFSVLYAVTKISFCHLDDLTSDNKIILFLLFPFFYHAVNGLVLKIQEISFPGVKVKTRELPQTAPAQEEVI